MNHGLSAVFQLDRGSHLNPSEPTRALSGRAGTTRSAGGAPC